MDIKYLEPSKVELGIRDRVYDELTKDEVIKSMIDTGKHTIVIRQGHNIGPYGSGSIDVVPVKYKGSTCFKVKFTLYDYSMYDTNNPFASALTGAYLLDGYAKMLAISESRTVEKDMENFPWVTATKKSKDSGVNKLIRDPSDYIDMAGTPIELDVKSARSKNPVKYIKQVLESKKMTQENRNRLSHEIYSYATKFAAQSRSIKYLDEDIQNKVAFMERLIDAVINNRPIRDDEDSMGTYNP